HRGVDCRHELDEAARVQGLIDGLLKAEEVFYVGQQVDLGLGVAGEDEDHDSGGLPVSRVEVNAFVGHAHGHEGFLEAVHARVRDGDAVLQAASDNQLAALDLPEKAFPGVPHARGGQVAELPERFELGAGGEILPEELVRKRVPQVKNSAPLEQVIDGGTGHERGDQGHHDERYEHALADQPVLEREQPQNDFHGAARVRSLKWRDSPMAIPMMKAPKTAWMPAYSV